jgi:UDP-2,3-diacylglucosamine pyrophosphatase LpxH
MIIYTSDLHLTDDPDDEYRWKIFDFLARQPSGPIIIGGDLTHRKDNHSGKLVNRIVQSLRDLRTDIYILKGNHDYTAQDSPFFAFLSAIDKLIFISEPTIVLIENVRVAFVPHGSGVHPKDEGKVERIIMHDLHAHELPRAAKKVCPILSGDDHIPHTEGHVTYIGAPYPITFGDDYVPRILLDDGKTIESVNVPTIRKMTIELPRENKRLDRAQKGDHVKLKVRLPRADLADYKRIVDTAKKMLEAQGVALIRTLLEIEDSGPPPEMTEMVLDPLKVLRTYGQEKQISPELMDVGRRIIGETNA